MIDIRRCAQEPERAMNEQPCSPEENPAFEAHSNKPAGHEDVFHVDTIDNFLARACTLLLHIHNRDGEACLGKRPGCTHRSYVRPCSAQKMQANPDRG